MTEGYLPVPGGMVWYRRLGSGGGTPLLVLHGGPGAGSGYLDSLTALAADRPVILYDQLGCGRSPARDDARLWRLERFVAEVRLVRRALGLSRCHLFGHSWGGWLALEYRLRHPGSGVAGLILASTSASMPEHRRELARLRAELPGSLGEVLSHYEASGDYGKQEYRAALHMFYQRHLCRLPDWPACLVETLMREQDNPAYRTMVGPNELSIQGSLADWDRTADLNAIRSPALVTVGRYDEITPACAETLHRGLRESRLVVFEDSAHVPHLEQPEQYLDAVATFMHEFDDYFDAQSDDHRDDL